MTTPAHNGDPMNLPAVINNAISRGVFPVDLDGKAQLFEFCNEGERRFVIVRAMLIAKARSENFPARSDRRPWLDWVQARWRYDDAAVHRMQRIGDMLIESIGKVTRASLFEAPMRKLQEIIILWSAKPDHLDAWLTHVDIAALTRDELRKKIHAYLDQKDDGKTKGGGKTQPADKPRQLDFFAHLDAVCKIDDDDRQRILDDPGISPLDTALSGLTLVDISLEKLVEANVFTPEQYEALITDLENKLEQAKDLAVQVSPVPLLQTPGTSPTVE